MLLNNCSSTVAHCSANVGVSDAFQILLCSLDPILSWFLQAFFLYRLYPGVDLVLAVSCRPFAELPEPSQSSLLYDVIYLLQLCLRPILTILTLSFHEIGLSIIRLWNLWCAAFSSFFCTTVREYVSTFCDVTEFFCLSIFLSVIIITRGQSNLTKSASRGGGIARLGVTPGGRKLYH